MRSLNALPYTLVCWLAARPRFTWIATVALVVAAHVMETPR